MEYLEELDKIHQKLATLNLATFELKEVNRLIERALRAGMTRNLEQSDPLAGYSNLTAAIKAGEPIDWEKLDGKRVQCVNPEVGRLRGVLVRNWRKPDTSDAWWEGEATASYINALYDGWAGKHGWSVWIEGEIPMRRKTADQLEPGYFFTGVLSGTTSESLMCVASGPGIGKNIRYASDLRPSFHPATKWEVVEEHGPFQKPEGK